MATRGALEWETSISRVVSEGAEEEEVVIVRGHRLSELIGRILFAEVMVLLLRGDLPSRHRRASSTPSSSPRRSMGSRRP
jgi:citrate synthase